MTRLRSDHNLIIKIKRKKMKRTIIILAFLIPAFAFIAKGQPSGVKSAAKSVFTIHTFRADGSLLATSHGVFISPDGEAISNLQPFLGAHKAVVIDQKGNKADVTRIIGTDAIYDVAHFRVGQKTTPITLASSKAATGSKAWLVGYALKNPEIKETSVKSVEAFRNQYSYYIFGMSAPDDAIACPVVNDAGELLGLLQVSSTSFDTHATDAAYVRTLVPNGLSYSNPVSAQLFIPYALPDDSQQAQLALMMATQSGDSLKYASAAEDYMARFPDQRDGYEALARLQMTSRRFGEARQTMEKALRNVTEKDQPHYDLGRIVLDKELLFPSDSDEWNLDFALSEARQAYAVKPMPLYRHLEARVLYAKGDYRGACSIFDELSRDKSFSTPELLYQQAQCKTMLGDDNHEIIALLDSAINTTDTMRINEAAPYFLARAQAYEAADSFRQAVFDYTRFEILQQGRVSADFFFARGKAEVKGRLFQQALGDYARAIALDPNEPTYYAETAQLQMRVNMNEGALKTAQRCTEVAPQYPEGWLILGLACIKNGDKATGLLHMRKAKELGSTQADALIRKYEGS